MSEINQNIREINNVGSRTTEILVHADAAPALREHGIVIAGISQALPGFEFCRPRPNLHQILGCISGTGEVWRDDAPTACEAGQAYVTSRNFPHRYRATSPQVWELCWVQFGDLGADARRVGLAEAPRLLAFDPLPMRDAIIGLYRETMGPASSRVLSLWAGLIQAHLLRSLETSSQSVLLQKIWDAVERDLARDWTLGELAKRANSSAEHLRRLCHEQYGVTPVRYVTNLRMRQARAMLASGSYTLETVAHRVGYSNPYAFSTAFQRTTGCAPGEYRKAQRGL